MRRDSIVAGYHDRAPGVKRSVVTLIDAIVVGFSGLVIGAVIGFLIGTTYGGNYAADFEFAGVRGYEAAGVLGELIGGSIGCLMGVAIVWRTRSPR